MCIILLAIDPLVPVLRLSSIAQDTFHIKTLKGRQLNYQLEFVIFYWLANPKNHQLNK